MARRADPERIETARREATRQRLMGLGVSEARADGWIDAWAKQAAVDSILPGGGYWDACWHWIEDQRRLRTKP